MREFTPARRNRTWIIGILLILLLTGDALLIKQNLRLRADLEKFRPDTISKGQVVPQFSGRTLQGDDFKMTFAADQPARVLLFFSPG
ncbi:MAG: hypothetical protein U0Z53_16400 [Blastocatellia bacterium]